MKKNKILAGVLVAALVIMVIKWGWFPTIKDDYFALNSRSLRSVPAGLVVVRPTRFPFLRHEDACYARAPHESDTEHDFWIVGRNAPLREVLAAAYDQPPAKVELPPGAPSGNFDFLITVKHGARPHLQAAIRQKLGYDAHREIRNAPVLTLQVGNPSLPGMQLSTNSEKRGFRFDDVKLHFTRLPVAVVPEVLKRFFNLSATVINKTGLTNDYDFSLRFDPATRREMHDEATARATADEVVKELGLELKTDWQPAEVLVVKMAGPVPPVVVPAQQTLLGPLNPGAEAGSEHWHHDVSGDATVLTDHEHPGTGTSDFTIENTTSNAPSHAEWRAAYFSLPAAAKGAASLVFSFAYTLPGAVKDGDNLRVQLRFFGAQTNFMEQKEYWVGSRSSDSAMTGYKTITDDDITPPAEARWADITMSANQYDDTWSSGVGRFDDVMVTVKK